MSVAPTHRIHCGGRGSFASLLFFLAAAPLCAQILDWEAAIATGGPGNSFFTEVEAAAGGSTGLPPFALASGYFNGTLNLGSQALSNPLGDDGVVARFERMPGPAWDVLWLAHASSATGNVRINDLVLDELGTSFYVAGTFSDSVTFVGGPTLSAPGATEGFVAVGDAGTGAWTSAFLVNGLEPQAIAVEVTGEIYLTGPGVLARKYLPAGGPPLWSTPASATTSALLGIALPPNAADPSLYVLSEDGSDFRGVAVTQLDRNGGTPNWESRVGGPGLDTGGGIAIGADGELRLAFSGQGSTFNYLSPTGNTDLPNIPPVVATHGVLLRISPGGDLVWSATLGRAQGTASEVKPSGVSVDAYGNTFTTAGFQGGILIESQVYGGNQDVAVFGVDAAGALFDFHQSTGAGVENPSGVGSPQRDLVLTVGSYTNSPSVFAGITLPPPPAGQTHAFFGALGAVPAQQRYVVSPIGGAPTVPELIDELHQRGGQVYNIVEFSGGGLAVSAFLTADQAAVIEDDPQLFIEPDYDLQPAGTSSSSGWALEHLNDATSMAGPYSYTYPEPGQTVNVYLLDTAVSNPSGWFNANTNLTIETTTLVRGTGDPIYSSVFQHGTEMLSLVAGPDVGAALGTPVVVKNFDFYPTGIPTTASLLADAIYQAIDYHLDNAECTPGVIVICSSGAALSSATVATAVAEAITEGLPVVVSAGNANANANGYIPASTGTTSGVLCVAGSKQDNAKEAGSNHTTVDLYAPGEAVRVINFASPGSGYGSFTGTSASAALVGGMVATYLSINPWATPADLETALVGDTYLDGGSGLSIAQLAPAGPAFFLEYDDWAAWFGLTDDAHGGDDDGDGWTNLQEYFFGLKPVKFDSVAAQSAISYSTATGKYTFDFNISSVLFDPGTLGTLLDGTTYEVVDSTTASGFSTAPGTLSVGSSTPEQTALSLENTVADPKCFLRVEISPASPSP